MCSPNWFSLCIVNCTSDTSKYVYLWQFSILWFRDLVNWQTKSNYSFSNRIQNVERCIVNVRERYAPPSLFIFICTNWSHPVEVHVPTSLTALCAGGWWISPSSSESATAPWNTMTWHVRGNKRSREKDSEIYYMMVCKCVQFP